MQDVLIDCAEAGASAGFMLPMPHPKAAAYWLSLAPSLECGDWVLFAAVNAADVIVGTVQLLVGQPENQPHRADIAKMLVRRDTRRRLAARSRRVSCAERGQDAIGARYGECRCGAALHTGGMGSGAGKYPGTRSGRMNAMRDDDFFKSLS